MEQGSSRIFYEVTRDALRTQLSLIDSVDRKLGVFFALASTLIAIAAGALAIRSTEAGRVAFDLLFASSAIYLMAATICIRGMRARGWRITAALDEVQAAIETGMEETGLYERLANTAAKAYEENASGFETKVRCVTSVDLLLLIEVAAVVATLVAVSLGR